MNAGTCWGKNTIGPRGRSVEKAPRSDFYLLPLAHAEIQGVNRSQFTYLTKLVTFLYSSFIQLSGIFTILQAGLNVTWHCISVVNIHVTFALPCITRWATGCTCFVDSLYFTTLYIYVFPCGFYLYDFRLKFLTNFSPRFSSNTQDTLGSPPKFEGRYLILNTPTLEAYRLSFIHVQNDR
jgi:hypothetical protein